MAEILIYSFGYSVQGICKFLTEELPVPIKVIVNPYKLEDKTNHEVVKMIDEAMREYVGRFKIIVVANPLVVSIAGEYLKMKYKNQKFVMFGQDMPKIIRRTSKIFVLASKRVRRTKKYQEMKAECQETEICELDCQKWLSIIDGGWLARDRMKEEVEKVYGSQIIIFHPELLLREKRVEEMVGWRGEVNDMRENLLDSLKVAMNMNI